MSVEARLNDLSSDFSEILESHAAVRGPAFARATAISFEIRQVLEILHRMRLMCREECQECADDMFSSATNIISSVMVKATDDSLSTKDVEDALQCADMLMERRINTVAKIYQDLEKGGREEP